MTFKINKSAVLMYMARGQPWLTEQIDKKVQCSCNYCFLCAYRYIENNLFERSDLENQESEYERIVNEIRKLPNFTNINHVLEAIAPKKGKK